MEEHARAVAPSVRLTAAPRTAARRHVRVRHRGRRAVVGRHLPRDQGASPARRGPRRARTCARVLTHPRGYPGICQVSNLSLDPNREAVWNTELVLQGAEGEQQRGVS